MTNLFRFAPFVVFTLLALPVLAQPGSEVPHAEDSNSVELPTDEFSNGPTDSIFDLDSKGMLPPNVEMLIDTAEVVATPNAKDVLTTARTMIRQKEIVIGSCWDYIDAIFKNAGYKQSQRLTVFKGKKSGVYAKQTTLQPGDWLYFINYAYKNIGHSAIFVGWTDYAKKEALLISYSGGNQPKPARYHVYNVKSVYNIMRAK